MNLREYLKSNILLFDGAMGTYYAMHTNTMGIDCEMANLSNPELIHAIHKEYLDAGCNALKTNTFGVNSLNYHGDRNRMRQVIEAGWQLACAAAKETGSEDHFVFADIGPVPGSEEKAVLQEYLCVVDAFIQQGAKNFLFETNSTDLGLQETAAYIRTKVPDAYIIVSFAVQPDGFTREGIYYQSLLQKMNACGSIDMAGLNCVSGARHMLELLENAHDSANRQEFLAMPNAGYPVVIQNRTFYEGDPVYFAQQMFKLSTAGASIIGGCCGTTPVHIAEIRKLLTGQSETGSFTALHPAEETKSDMERTERNAPVQEESPFWNKLAKGQKVIAVEFDPPKDANLDSFMEGAKRLQAAGTDILTIADCPIARARMDSSLLACKVKRELHMDALPHMTCRDRNLNATKALILGLFAEGVRNVLTVTGDPIPTAERDEVKSVCQFNSRKLARYICTLNTEVMSAPIHLFGALNLSAHNFDVELRIAQEKINHGINGFLTQPILTKQAFENLRTARAGLETKILGGIIPIVSERNARYMHSEVNGILVAPEIIALYEGKSREECEQLAVDISTDIAQKISPYVDGYYLMTPFNRVRLMERLLAHLRENLCGH